MLPCGDALCKRCAVREGPAARHRLSCRVAKISSSSWTRNPKPSVQVVAVVEKLWGDDVKSADLRIEGNVQFENRNFVRALDAYRKAESLRECFMSNF